MQSRFGEDDLRSRKPVSMQLAALDAKSSARMGSSRSGTMQGVVILYRSCAERLAVCGKIISAQQNSDGSWASKAFL